MQRYAIVGPRASRPRAIMRFGFGGASRRDRIWSGGREAIGPSHIILRAILCEKSKSSPDERTDKGEHSSNPSDVSAHVVTLMVLGIDRVRHRAEKSLYVESKVVSTALDLEALAISTSLGRHLRSLARKIALEAGSKLVRILDAEYCPAAFATIR